ncbi:MAG TPA: hypothetical protein VHA78_05185 [Candidatus Peribacteraceae bacterium]|nr:hypothetical protein [Candidatus Peribacteraceae bacterium]
MTPTDKLLRQALTFQGIFYLLTGLWALVATPHFLSFTNPAGDLFQAQSFAALIIVIAIFFLVGAWRADLLRPASFLGFGIALAIVLVELFHLPAIGWTLLWFDFAVEIALSLVYIVTFFFNQKEESPAPTSPVTVESSSPDTEEKEKEIPTP